MVLFFYPVKYSLLEFLFYKVLCSYCWSEIMQRCMIKCINFPSTPSVLTTRINISSLPQSLSMLINASMFKSSVHLEFVVVFSVTVRIYLFSRWWTSASNTLYWIILVFSSLITNLTFIRLEILRYTFGSLSGISIPCRWSNSSWASVTPLTSVAF